MPPTALLTLLQLACRGISQPGRRIPASPLDCIRRRLGLLLHLLLPQSVLALDPSKQWQTKYLDAASVSLHQPSVKLHLPLLLSRSQKVLRALPSRDHLATHSRLRPQCPPRLVALAASHAVLPLVAQLLQPPCEGAAQSLVEETRCLRRKVPTGPHLRQ